MPLSASWLTSCPRTLFICGRHAAIALGLSLPAAVPLDADDEREQGDVTVLGDVGEEREVGPSPGLGVEEPRETDESVSLFQDLEPGCSRMSWSAGASGSGSSGESGAIDMVASRG